MGGQLTRINGIARFEACLGLKNLSFNFLSFLQCSGHISVVALILLRRCHGQCSRQWLDKVLLLCALIGGLIMFAEALQSYYFMRFGMAH